VEDQIQLVSGMKAPSGVHGQVV